MHWLAILRVGLGVEVILYSMSLRKDWIFLLSGTVRLASRNAAFFRKAILFRDSAGLLTLAAHVGVDENPVTLRYVGLAYLLAGCSLVIGYASRSGSDFRHGFFTSARRRAVDLSPIGMDSFMTIGLFYLMLSSTAGPMLSSTGD